MALSKLPFNVQVDKVAEVKITPKPDVVLAFN